MTEQMQGFAGFTEDEGDVPLPTGFFSELLPVIDDLDELKLTLFLLQARSAAERPLFFSVDALHNDIDLVLSFVQTAHQSSKRGLQAAIERATARGTLLRVIMSREDEAQPLYLINDAAGRQIAADIEAGHPHEAEVEQMPAAWRVERPNIFILYEQNVGLLQPLIADELRDAEKAYPMSWIEEAFQIAVEQNVRNWRYIRAILERWAREGKSDGLDQDGSQSVQRRYVEGEYGQIIKR